MDEGVDKQCLLHRGGEQLFFIHQNVDNCWRWSSGRSQGGAVVHHQRTRFVDNVHLALRTLPSLSTGMWIGKSKPSRVSYLDTAPPHQNLGHSQGDFGRILGLESRPDACCSRRGSAWAALGVPVELLIKCFSLTYGFTWNGRDGGRFIGCVYIWLSGVYEGKFGEVIVSVAKI